MTALALALLLMSPGATPPSLVRVVVVDNSPSMAGDRIAVVRGELIKVIKQLPPSADYPLLLIVFHGSVDPTVVFIDAPSAERAINNLRGDGSGTHIAPALLRAYEELRRLMSAKNVLVLLYTDGEDGDKEGIRRAEEQLDSLFADRGQQGLSSTVFVKRWGGANAELIERIRQRGHAQVLDAGEFQMEPVTVDPAVTVVDVRRDPKNSRRISVTYVPSVALRGAGKPSNPVTLQFQCLNPGVVGNVTSQATVGVQSQQFTVVVPVPPEAETARRFDLRFRVASPANPRTQGTFLLPLMPTSQLTIPVALPPLVVVNQLAAVLENVVAEGWADPLTCRVRCRAELAVTLTAADADASVDRGIVLRVVPSAVVRLRMASDQIAVRQPGKIRLPIALEVDLGPPSSASLRATQPIDLELGVVSTADYVRCQPSRLPLHHIGVAIPGRVPTTIKSTVRRVGSPVWVDLVEPLAEFEAEVAFEVTGPIPERTTVALVSPATIRNNVLPPGTLLRTGETVVPLRVLARLTPGRREQLDFTILPPAPTPALEFRVASGFSLSVPAPRPAVLVHVAGGKPQNFTQVTMADNQELISLMLSPAPWGVDCERVRRTPRVMTGTRDTTVRLVAPSTALRAPHAVQVRLLPPANQPFFLDVTQTVDLDMRPAETAPAVLPGRVRLCVVRQAPFKRLLTYLSWALFPVGMLFMVFRVVRRLRDVQSV